MLLGYTSETLGGGGFWETVYTTKQKIGVHLILKTGYAEGRGAAASAGAAC